MYFRLVQDDADAQMLSGLKIEFVRRNCYGNELALSDTLFFLVLLSFFAGRRQRC